MRITEIDDQQKKMKKIREFAKWAIDKLGINDMPEIKYGHDIALVKQNRTFGSTRPDGQVWVHVGDRNAADTMRTLVHELIHVRQFQQGTATTKMDDDQRQFIEDEANALAGRILREYGKKDSTIYENKQSKPCCIELKRALLKNKKTDYDSIDRMMTVVAKKHSITPKQLHDYWVSEYKKTPDDWIKQQLSESYGENDLIESIINSALLEIGITGRKRS